MADYTCEKCGSVYGAKHVNPSTYKARHLTAEQCEKYGLTPESDFATGPWLVHDTSCDESTYWGPFTVYENALKWAQSLHDEYQEDGEEGWIEIESTTPVHEEFNG